MITARHSRLSVLLSALVVAIQVPAFTAAPADPLDAVRARFAPDRRLALFDVSIQKQDEGVVVRGEVESPAARDAAIEAARGTGAARVIDRITVLPAAALGADTQAVVRVSVANVRGKPAHSAEMVTQTLMGWSVRVLKEQSGWYLVHTEPDGYLGWIEELQLARMTPERRSAWEGSSLAGVTAPFSVMREAASPGANPTSDIVMGALVRPSGLSNGWMRAELPDGRSGYLAPADVQMLAPWKASRQPSAAAFERTATLLDRKSVV
jgi:hypothetical protein